MKWRELLGAVILSLTIGVTDAGPASAQDTQFPEKLVTLVVPYPPGGGGDGLARIIQPKLAEVLGVDVIIENIPGAGGVVGLTRAANLPADGHTIALWVTPSHEMAANTEGVAFKPADFVGLGAPTPQLVSLSVPADRPWATVQELLDAMRAAPETISIGGIGPFGSGGQAYAYLTDRFGVTGRWVPFQGTAEVTTALLGGHVDVAVITNSEKVMAEYVRAGRIRILSVLGERVIGEYAGLGLQTIGAQTGIDIPIESNRGFVVRADTPPERVAVLREALRRAAEDPEVVAQIEQRLGLYDFTDGEGLTRMIQSPDMLAILPVLQELAGQ